MTWQSHLWIAAAIVMGLLVATLAQWASYSAGVVLLVSLFVVSILSLALPPGRGAAFVVATALVVWAKACYQSSWTATDVLPTFAIFMAPALVIAASFYIWRTYAELPPREH